MKDKVIVITGASGGIGASLAELVGRRGARPVLVARRAKELDAVAGRSGPHALPVVGDVTRRADVVRVFEQAVARFGHVDVWVNNAGRGISRAPSELTDEDFDDMMLVNVKAVMYGMQTALPHFRDRRQGQIINVSSLLGRLPLVTFRAAYCASKHAMNSLTASFRMELGGAFPDIHIGTVHPGVVATDFGRNALHGGMDSRKFPGAQSPEEVAEVIAGVIDRPRADVYTRPDGQKMVIAYYAAEDMGAAERQPPFGGAPPPFRP
jgi:NAD(P)-dependent dehydrogenase (short-subunit alcohol dehydrogenase family)